MISQHSTFWTFIILFIMLINLTGQLCQLVDSPLLKQFSSSSSTPFSPSSSSSSSSSDFNSVSSDSTIIISDSSSFSSPLSSSTSPQLIPTSNADDGGDNKLHSTPLNHRGSKRKRYQPARYLVRPFFLNPKHTWKAFQMNVSRNEAKDAEMRKIRDKKRAKIRKLADKMKKAALISEKLYLLLNEISMNLDSELV